jgi:hypothetical protein
MLESKDHWLIIEASGALDLTFASRTRSQVGCECQIRSTSNAYYWRVSVRLIPGRAWVLRVGTVTNR